jgi:TonB-linked SusC/RagA family outer membrane protein
MSARSKIKSIRNLFLVCILLSVSSRAAASLTVEGKVLDATGKTPVYAAQVRIENFSAAISDEEGNFSIKAPNENAVLRVNAWGYQVKHFPLKGRSKVVVLLVSDDFKSLNPLLEFPFGEQALQSVPYAVSGFRSEPPAQSLSLTENMQKELGMLRGINRSAAPASGKNTYLRGLNSLYGSSQPLYIIDGVPFETLTGKHSIIEGNYSDPLSTINPEDVESITLIRDAYALYGIKAANGAVLIRTRRAREQTSRISVGASWGVVSAPRQIPVLQSKDYRAYALEQIGGAGYTEQEIQDQLYLNDDPSRPYYHTFHNNTNWQDEIFQNATVQRYYGQVTGGDDIAGYAISIGYDDAESVMKTGSMNRFSSRFNSDIKFTERLLFALGLSFSQVNKQLRDDGCVQLSSPTYLSLIKSPLVSPYLLGEDGSRLPTDADEDFWGLSNPVSILLRGLGENSQQRVDLNGKLEYSLNKQWMLTGLFGYNTDKLTESYFLPDYGVASVELERIRQVSRNYVQNRSARYIGVYTNLNAQYRGVWNYIHQLRLNAGLRYHSNQYLSQGGSGYNTVEDKFIYLTNNLLAKAIFNENNRWLWGSAYLDAQYTLKNTFDLSFNLSADASSRTGSKHRSGVFSSAAASWLLSSEKFMADARAIDLLKLRISAGRNGSDDLGPANPRGYFGSVSYMNMMGLSLRNLNNEDLKYETTDKANLGLDLAVFNERLALSVDLYQHLTHDLITMRDAKQVSGFDYVWVNEGSLQNRGLEASLNLRLVDTRKFKWNLQAGLGHYKNRLKDLANDIFTEYSGATVLSRQGNPLGVFYGYRTQGVFGTYEEAQAANLKTLSNNSTVYQFKAGDIHFADLNNDGWIDEKDRVIIGDPNPDFYGSLSTRLSYAGFSLDAVFSGVYGNDIYNHLRAGMEAMDSFNNQSASVLNRWKGQGHAADIPRAAYNDPGGNARFSDRWIEDGSYLKLQKLGIEWAAPGEVLFLDGLRVFIYAENLVTWTNYLGRDPDLSHSNYSLLQGIDRGYLPQSRSFMAGIKINL